MCKYISLPVCSQNLPKDAEDSFQQGARGCELARWLASIAVDVSVWLAVAAPEQPIRGDDLMEHLNDLCMMFQVAAAFCWVDVGSNNCTTDTHVAYTHMCNNEKRLSVGPFSANPLLGPLLKRAALQQCVCTSHTFTNTHGPLQLLIHSNQEACRCWRTWENVLWLCKWGHQLFTGQWWLKFTACHSAVGHNLSTAQWSDSTLIQLGGQAGELIYMAWWQKKDWAKLVIKKKELMFPLVQLQTRTSLQEKLFLIEIRALFLYVK